MPGLARCPQCTTTLEVDDDLGPTEQVECPVCLTRFIPDGSAPDPRPADSPAEADAVPPPLPREERPPAGIPDDEDLDRPRRKRRSRKRNTRAAMIEEISGPANGVMAIGIIGLVFGGIGVLMWAGILVFALTAQAQGPGQPNPGTTADDLIGFAVNFAITILQLGIAIVITYGAIKMKRLESYPWAMAATWLSVLPCFSPCCILGLVFGIQGIRILNDPDVKAAFYRDYELTEDE